MPVRVISSQIIAPGQRLIIAEQLLKGTGANLFVNWRPPSGKRWRILYLGDQNIDDGGTPTVGVGWGKDLNSNGYITSGGNLQRVQLSTATGIEQQTRLQPTDYTPFPIIATVDCFVSIKYGTTATKIQANKYRKGIAIYVEEDDLV